MQPRVLVITPGYPGPDNPQAAIFVHRQIQRLAQQGAPCRVLTYRPAPPRFPRWLTSRSWLRYFAKRPFWPSVLDGVPVATVHYERSWQANEDTVPAMADALIRFLERNPKWCEIDVAYSHWLWTGGAVALRVGERFGWPVATIARGSELHDWHSVHVHCKGHVENVLRKADVILANCQDLRERADALVPGSGSRMEVIYNGCDTMLFRPAEDKAGLRAEIGFAPDDRVMVFCGEIIKRKGIQELTDAWERFAGGHGAWKLLLVGKITEPSLAREMTRRCGESVRFLGQKPQQEIIRLLQAADAFILPSRLEGLANAAMEAMAVGLPIITTATCGQRELVRHMHNGWLIPPGDAYSIRQALEELADDPPRAEALGQLARETIVRDFNPTTQVAKLRDVLLRAKATRSSPLACEPVS